MTKQVQALPTPSVSSVISMSVTTDSVVAVYVSEYEDKLYARQAELKATLVQVNKKLTEPVVDTNCAFTR